MKHCVVIMFLGFAAFFPSFLGATEHEKPGAFVEGTRDYAIKYLDDMRPKLAKYYGKGRAAMTVYDELLKKTKKENVLLLERIQKLQAAGQFLKADDPALLNYRKTLNELTAHFFVLMRNILYENDPGFP